MNDAEAQAFVNLVSQQQQTAQAQAFSPLLLLLGAQTPAPVQRKVVEGVVVERRMLTPQEAAELQSRLHEEPVS